MDFFQRIGNFLGGNGFVSDDERKKKQQQQQQAAAKQQQAQRPQPSQPQALGLNQNQQQQPKPQPTAPVLPSLKLQSFSDFNNQDNPQAPQPQQPPQQQPPKVAPQPKPAPQPAQKPQPQHNPVEDFFNATANVAGHLGSGVVQSVQDFVHDPVKELKGMAQAPFRGIGAIGTSINSLLPENMRDKNPNLQGNSVGKAIFGSDPIDNVTKQGQDIANLSLNDKELKDGKTANINPLLATLIGTVSAASDINPLGGGKKKVLKSSVEDAKKATEDAIKAAEQHVGRQLTDQEKQLVSDKVVNDLEKSTKPTGDTSHPQEPTPTNPVNEPKPGSVPDAPPSSVQDIVDTHKKALDDYLKTHPEMTPQQVEQAQQATKQRINDMVMQLNHDKAAGEKAVADQADQAAKTQEQLHQATGDAQKQQQEAANPTDRGTAQDTTQPASNPEVDANNAYNSPDQYYKDQLDKEKSLEQNKVKRLFNRVKDQVYDPRGIAQRYDDRWLQHLKDTGQVDPKTSYLPSEHSLNFWQNLIDNPDQAAKSRLQQNGITNIFKKYGKEEGTKAREFSNYRLYKDELWRQSQGAPNTLGIDPRQMAEYVMNYEQKNPEAIADNRVLRQHALDNMKRRTDAGIESRDFYDNSAKNPFYSPRQTVNPDDAIKLKISNFISRQPKGTHVRGDASPVSHSPMSAYYKDAVDTERSLATQNRNNLLKQRADAGVNGFKVNVSAEQAVQQRESIQKLSSISDLIKQAREARDAIGSAKKLSTQQLAKLQKTVTDNENKAINIMRELIQKAKGDGENIFNDLADRDPRYADELAALRAKYKGDIPTGQRRPAADDAFHRVDREGGTPNVEGLDQWGSGRGTGGHGTGLYLNVNEQQAYRGDKPITRRRISNTMENPFVIKTIEQSSAVNKFGQYLMASVNNPELKAELPDLARQAGINYDPKLVDTVLENKKAELNGRDAGVSDPSLADVDQPINDYMKAQGHDGVINHGADNASAGSVVYRGTPAYERAMKEFEDGGAGEHIYLTPEEKRAQLKYEVEQLNEKYPDPAIRTQQQLLDVARSIGDHQPTGEAVNAADAARATIPGAENEVDALRNMFNQSRQDINDLKDQSSQTWQDIMDNAQHGETGTLSVPYMVDGEKGSIQIPADLAEEYARNNNGLNRSPVVRAANAVAGVVKTTWTGILAPAFQVFQIAKNIPLAYRNAEGISGINLPALQGFTGQVFQTQRAKEFKQELLQRGAVFENVLQSRNIQRETVNDIVAHTNLKTFFDRSPIRSFADLAHQINNGLAYIQNAQRAAVARGAYERAISRGIPHEDALKLASEAPGRVFGDLNRVSQLAQSLEPIIPYSGATQAGTRAMIRATKERPFETTFKDVTMIAGLGGIAAYSIANNSQYYQDMVDSGNEQKLDNNVSVVLPWASRDDKGNWTGVISIPLTPDFRPFNRATWRSVYSMGQGGGIDPGMVAGEIFNEFTGDMARNVEDPYSTNNGANPANGILAGSPFMTIGKIMAGVDPRTGQPLSNEFDSRLARTDQAHTNTSDTAKNVSSVLGGLFTPLQVDSFLSELGSVGKMAKGNPEKVTQADGTETTRPASIMDFFDLSKSLAPGKGQSDKSKNFVADQKLAEAAAADIQDPKTFKEFMALHTPKDKNQPTNLLTSAAKANQFMQQSGDGSFTTTPLFNAEKNYNDLRKQAGLPSDPLFDLAPQELQKVLMYRSMKAPNAAGQNYSKGGEGAFQALGLDNKWYDDFQNAESEYFKSLGSTSKQMTFSGTEKPKLSTEQQKVSDSYYSLPAHSAERRAVLNANPWLKDYWASSNGFTDQERKALGFDSLNGDNVYDGQTAGSGFGGHGHGGINPFDQTNDYSPTLQLLAATKSKDAPQVATLLQKLVAHRSNRSLARLGASSRGQG